MTTITIDPSMTTTEKRDAIWNAIVASGFTFEHETDMSFKPFTWSILIDMPDDYLNEDEDEED